MFGKVLFHNNTASSGTCLIFAKNSLLITTDYSNIDFKNNHAINYDGVFYITTEESVYILVKVPCECITGNIARGRGREPIKHEAQPSALFARDHAPSAIFPVNYARARTVL